MKKAILALVLGLAPALWASSSAVDVSSFSIDTTLVLGLYNSVDQNTNQITSFPAEFVNQYKGVIQATVRNSGSGAVTPTFDLIVKQNGLPVAYTTNGSLTINSPLNAGETRTLNAADFIASSPFAGTIDPAFEADLKNNFQNADPSKLKDTVTAFLAKRYTVCLVSFSNPGMQACWDVTIFKEKPFVALQRGHAGFAA